MTKIQQQALIALSPTAFDDKRNKPPAGYDLSLSSVDDVQAWSSVAANE